MTSSSRISLWCGIFSCFCSLAFSDIRDQRYTDAVVALEPLAYYQFNETEGTILYDSTSHDIDGTYLNDPNLFYSGVFNPSLGTAVGFDGTDDYIEVADTGVLNIRRQVSFSFWLKVDSFKNTWTPLIYKAGTYDSPTRTYSLFLNNTGYLHLTSADVSGQQNADTPAGTIALNKWYHIVGVIDRTAGQLRTYVNGSLKASGTIRTTDTVSNSQALYIAGYPLYTEWGYLDGTIDELAIYDKVLSDEDVELLHLASTGPEVVAVEPDSIINLKEESFDSILISFSDPIDFTGDNTGSFWLDDIKITGPAGSVEPINITALSDMGFEIQFPAQTTVGSYSFQIGPNITDIDGLLMDQDQDAMLGETNDDIFKSTVLAHQGGVQYFEDFEYMDSVWSIDNGVWQIGKPTSGPGVAFSGENVAGTVLGGNYPIYTDSRLISPVVNLPEIMAKEEIVLRFMQWFSYAGESRDYGQVHIQYYDVGTSSWSAWQVLGYSADDYSSGWSRNGFDLSSYAGQQIRISFWHYEDHEYAGYYHDQHYESAGWYIDDVSVEVRPVVILDTVEDFEDGWDGWTATNGVWQIGKPTSGPGVAFSGENVAGTVLGGNYPIYTDSRLISPVVNLPEIMAKEEIVLRFMQWFSYAGESRDYGQVHIQYYDVGTSSWSAWQVLGYSADDYSSGWSRNGFDLSSYAGQQIRISFWHYEDHEYAGYYHDQHYESAGWYIDDVSVEVRPVVILDTVEDFEDGWDGWTATNGVWQIGKPTSGPGVAFSGENVAGTVLGGNYPIYTDSRLISPVVNLPEIMAKEEIVLRFMQWFSYAGESRDYGQVHIQYYDVGTSSWSAWQVLGYSADDYSSGWSRNGFDLSSYAGQQIRISFWHYEDHEYAGYYHDQHYESAGWYIDDVSVEVRPVVILDTVEDFEDGWDGWTATNGVWQIGKPTSGPGVAFSGENVAGTVLGGNYPIYTDSRLISPVVNLPEIMAKEEIVLRFMQWFSYAGESRDYGQVHIQYYDVGTSSWSAWQVLGYSADDYSSGWSRNGFDLSSYAGQQIRISFWHYEDHEYAGYYHDQHYESAGWYIDDVSVEVRPVVILDTVEDFEDGWDGWTATNGVWQIGKPTSGPGVAFSGENVAGTVLGGNYPIYTDSRLISPVVNLPEIMAKEEIVLRFMQWFSYAGESRDYGQVHIQYYDVGTSSWSAWQVLGYSADDYSSGWSRNGFDLSSYAGQQIRISFWHYEDHEYAGYYHDQHYESAGWYIDDVSVEVRPVVILDTVEDFEDGWDGWTATNGVWQIGKPTSGPGVAFSGENVAGTVLGGNYPIYTDSRLISPVVNLPEIMAKEEIVLRFMQWFSYAGESRDYGQVHIQYYDVGTSSWSAWQVLGYSADDYSSGWSRNGFDLSSYAGQQIRISFWHYEDHEYAGYYHDQHYESAGWYIDDVSVEVRPVVILDTVEDFEDGWDGWTATNGVWQIGKPTSGPGVAFSGENVAGTVLGGNYPIYTDSRLISPVVNLPEIMAKEEIVLRFMQWFSYAGESRDYGQVHIQYYDVGTSSWSAWQVLGYSADDYSSGWSRNGFDLSSYAGQQIRISFWHYEDHEYAGYYHDQHYESAGWYIDDVSVEVRPVVILDTVEDFEDGWDGWTATNGVWQIGKPTSGPGVAFSGENVAGTVLGGNYPIYTDSRLISPVVNLPLIKGGDVILLRFRNYYTYASSSDYGIVQIKVLDKIDTDWIELIKYSGSNGSQWNTESIDLSEYAGHILSLSFFHYEDHEYAGYYHDQHYESAGWYIDDVHLNTFSPSPLTIGQGHSGSLSGITDRDYYVVQVPSGGHLKVTLDDLDNLGSNEVYLRYGALPTAGTYDYKYTLNGKADQEIFIPNAKPGYWYILVCGNDVPGDGAYTLKVDAFTGVFLDKMTPGQHGNVPDTVLTLFGAGFTPEAKVELIQNGQVILPAQQSDYISGTQLTATFDFDAVDPNDNYLVRVTAGDSFDELPFILVKAIGPKLETNLIVPGQVGYHQPAMIWVEYANTGDTAMPAPLLVVGARQNDDERAILRAASYMVLTGQWESPSPRGFWTYAMPEGYANTVQILASGNTAGLLQPGEKKKVPIQWAGWQQPWNFAYPPITFTLGVVQANNTDLVGWADMKDQMRPDSIPTDTWDALWANFMSQTGVTWGDYVRMLHNNAEYLGKLGLYVNDISELLAFEFAQADGLNIVRTLSSATDAVVPAPGLSIDFSRVYSQNITNRYTQGILGRGWSHNWDYRLDFISDGTIKMHTPGGGVRIYQPDSRAGRPYFSMEGDHAVFQAMSGGYSHQESNGLLRVFGTDGKLNYVQDTNGNRLTCTYDGSFLIQIEHNNGKYLNFAYKANGLLEAVVDPVGRQTTYAYDSGNEYLTSVTYFDSKSIQYTYDTGDNVSKKHALTSITYPGDSHQFFDYSSFGKLASMYKDNQAEKFDFTYDSAGMVSVACACTGGNQSKYYLDQNGMLSKAINPLNEGVFLKYDSDYNLTSIIDPAGRSYNYTYNDEGELIHITDPLGNGTRLGYFGIYDRLTSLVDAKGNLTQYGYDTFGNLKSITYDDNSVESWGYDTQGNPTSWTNRRGSPISYEYNSDGYITAKIYKDGSRADFVYSSRGNLESVTDTNGTTTFEYDANDQLIKITYPQNRWLAYTYNAAGQRATMINQLGHVLTYHYDVVGRLESITDENNSEIVHYYYDLAGRMERKVLGNGVYTVYVYDPAGRIQNLTNYKSEGVILSGFDYTYDARGRRISMTTTYGDPDDPRNAYEGQWLYEYDDLGQLTAWTDPTRRRVEYQYDALGNRIAETDNGVVTNYTTNALNQYTQRGDTTYQYDKDGNLIQEICPSGTTTYTYNDENKLIAVSFPQGNWLYTYDAMGNRIRVDDKGIVSDYVIDPIGFGDVVGEYDHPTAQLLTTYDHGFGLLSQNSVANGTSYYTFDAIGNTQELIHPAQQILNNYVYEPFGNKLINNEVVYNPFKYVGEFGVEKETNGLIFMRNRFYASALGKFDSEDPIGVWGGDYNLYRYVGNQVLGSVDPVGLSAYDDVVRNWITIGDKSNLGSLRNKYPNDKPLRDANDYRVARSRVKDLPSAVKWTTAVLIYHKLKIEAQKYGLKPSDLNPLFELLNKLGLIDTDKLVEKGSDRDWWLEADWNQLLWELRGIIDALKEYFANISRPWDPNLKSGPLGYGPLNFVSLNSSFPYRIDFENDPNATAPAQVVEIKDPLNVNLDWTTFELTEIGFGDVMISIPEGSQHFEKKIPFSFNGVNFEVEIEAGINLGTGEVYAYFYSVDPWTGLPPAVNIGFLPPEDGTGRGMGYVSYNIKAKQDLVTGTEIRNIAHITFDYAETIATNQIDPHDPSKGTDPNLECLITIDADLPESYIEPLDAETMSPLILTITGQDVPGGSGIGSYDIYVSDNGGEFVLWKSTSDNTIEFDGQVNHTYAFYSIAKDNAGNYEDRPEIADTTTTIVQKHLMMHSWNLVSAVRVGRTTYDYTFSVSLENTRKQDVSNVVMTVQPYETNVTLIDGQISISSIPANSTVTSTDTITLRVDYTQPTPTIKLAGQIAFDSTSEPGQVQDFISHLLIGTNREIGDITGDGSVDIQDLSILMNDWLRGNSLADIAPPPNGDGIVNLNDYAIMAENWMVTVDN